MSENSAKLSENQYIKELFSILKENGKDIAGLAALIAHVNEMEGFVKRSEDAITVMKSQLAEIKEVQEHPVKASLTKVTNSLEKKVTNTKEQLSDIKSNIIESCKKTIVAFKEKGISALDKLTTFVKLKHNLQAWKKSIDSIIQTDDKAIAKIETFANEYHSAGQAIKNMVKVATGKPPDASKKEIGKIAKTLSMPYEKQKTALNQLQSLINKSIDKLDNLEVAASAKHTAQKGTKKPSIIEQLNKNKALVDAVKQNAIVRESTKSRKAEL